MRRTTQITNILPNSYDYDVDENFTGELGPELPYKRATTSCTPDGWIRKYKYLKVLKPGATPKHLDL